MSHCLQDYKDIFQNSAISVAKFISHLFRLNPSLRRNYVDMRQN